MSPTDAPPATFKDPAAVDRLLQEFRGLQSRFSTYRWQHLQQRLDGLLSGMQSLRAVWRQLDRHLADDYNIFEVLGITRLEDLTHSNMLANLLNPTGSHGQGDLFYRHFLEQLEGLPPQFSPDAAVRVSRERWTGDGSIDLFIQSTDRERPYCILIENKIKAGDQPQQLKRYICYCIKGLKYPKAQVLVLYLKDGSAPSETSLEEAERKSLIGHKLLHYLSYKQHISGMLESALPFIQAPKVQVLVRQYLEITKKLI